MIAPSSMMRDVTGVSPQMLQYKWAFLLTLAPSPDAAGVCNETDTLRYRALQELFWISFGALCGSQKGAGSGAPHPCPLFEEIANRRRVVATRTVALGVAVDRLGGGKGRGLDPERADKGADDRHVLL